MAALLRLTASLRSILLNKYCGGHVGDIASFALTCKTAMQQSVLIDIDDARAGTAQQALTKIHELRSVWFSFIPQDEWTPLALPNLSRAMPLRHAWHISACDIIRRIEKDSWLQHKTQPALKHGSFVREFLQFRPIPFLKFLLQHATGNCNYKNDLRLLSANIRLWDVKPVARFEDQKDSPYRGIHEGQDTAPDSLWIHLRSQANYRSLHPKLPSHQVECIFQIAKRYCFMKCAYWWWATGSLELALSAMIKHPNALQLSVARSGGFPPYSFTNARYS